MRLEGLGPPGRQAFQARQARSARLGLLVQQDPVGLRAPWDLLAALDPLGPLDPRVPPSRACSFVRRPPS